MSYEDQPVAVLLSGCGFLDGAEIQESVSTFLALDQAGVKWEAIAPNRKQNHVINHLDQSEDQTHERNILQESARIARCDIKSLEDADAEDYSALLLPGGFGAAKQFSTFGLVGDVNYSVFEDIQSFAQAIQSAGKPAGYICISPMIAPFVYPEGTQITVGQDADLIHVIESKGLSHVKCRVDEICVDENQKLVSTPAYLLGENSYQVYLGISQLVDQVLALR